MGTSSSKDELFATAATTETVTTTDESSLSPLTTTTTTTTTIDDSMMMMRTSLDSSSNHNQQQQQTVIYKIVIYGDVGVGKTSLNRRLVGKPYQKLEKKTIGKNVFHCEVEFFQRLFKFTLTDFSGQRHFINISTMNVKDADVVIFVYDVSRKSTFLNIVQWYQTAMENSDQSSGRMVTTKEGEEFARENNMLFFECSAKQDTDLDKKILLILAKRLSDSQSHNDKKSSLIALGKTPKQIDEWIFHALLRNDNSQTIPVTITYSRIRSNLTIRKDQPQKTTQKNKRDIFMGIELSTTKQMHYCMNSKTILILDNDPDLEQRILWTCSISRSDIAFADLIDSLVFEAKVSMIEISEFGSVSDVLTTYTKQCVFLKEIPSPAIVNQFQMMNSNVDLKLDLSNFSFFQAAKNKSRSLQIQSIFEPIKWTYGMISILNLEDAWISDLGIEILCDCLRLQCIFQLRSLRLVNNEISEVGCNHLRALFYNTSNLPLEEFDISNNPLMRDKGCKRIVEIAKSLPKLQYLNLSNCGATNDVATLLIEVLNSNRRLKLNLSNSNINMSVSDIILALPEDCLKLINFTNNPIMSDTRISIATEDPKTMVEVQPTKHTGSKVLIDQSKLQINRRVMNSVTSYGNPITFHAMLKINERVPVEIRVFQWCLDRSQRTDAMKSILQDLSSLGRFEHQNLVPYYGLYCIDSMVPPSSLNVVVAQFGTPLSYLLYMASVQQFTVKEKISIAYEVAIGIQHLHSLGSFHLNICSDSVMVARDENNGSLQVKMAYYGLAKWVQKGYVHDIRNPTYQSPELLKSKGKTGGTQKSDVYAFSILLWELWYSKRPYSSEEIYYRNRKEMLRQIQDAGKRPELSTITTEKEGTIPNLEKRLHSLMHKCWQHDSTLRPDFKFICIALKDIVESL